MKIGVITIHSDLNYGAFLQAFATVAFLRNKGYDAKLIDYRKIPNSPRNYKFPKNLIFSIYNLPRLFRYRNFVKPMLSNIRYNDLDSLMNNFNEDFDVLVSGSDQIWNPICGGFVNKLNPAYYLAFASKEKYKKIAYASSVGSYVFNKDEQEKIKKWLDDYSHLSTREQAGAIQLESFLGRKVRVVLDPSLLLNRTDWLKFASKVRINTKYVLVYYIDELNEVVSFARRVADKYGYKVALITNMQYKPKGVDIKIPHCGPAQFLWLFDNASYVVTNSFHGTAFAVNFNKDFVSVIKRNSPQRQQTLLSNVGLIDRLLEDVKQLDNLSEHVDWIEVNKKMEQLRSESCNYLINAIEK